MMATPNLAPVTSFQYGDTRQVQNDSSSSYFIHIKRTAVVQLVGGCLLVAMGIAAILLLALWSYFATAIWSGVIIFSLTGVIGISAASRRSRSLARVYLAMSILSCFMGFALFEMHIYAAAFEDDGRWYYGEYHDRVCQPSTYTKWIPNCMKSLAARKTVDALICCTGFFLFVTGIVAASFGCCASCKGCETCCKQCCCGGSGCSQCCNPNPPVTATFQAQGPTFVSTGQPQAGLYVVQQGPAPVNQYPQVVVPSPTPTKHSCIPAANQMSTVNQAPPQSPPPSYNVAGQGQSLYPPVE